MLGTKEQGITLCHEYCNLLPFTERSCRDLCCFFKVWPTGMLYKCFILHF